MRLHPGPAEDVSSNKLKVFTVSAKMYIPSPKTFWKKG